jgi:hypothetical protein
LLATFFLPIFVVMPKLGGELFQFPISFTLPVSFFVLVSWATTTGDMSIALYTNGSSPEWIFAYFAFFAIMSFLYSLAMNDMEKTAALKIDLVSFIIQNEKEEKTEDEDKQD